MNDPAFPPRALVRRGSLLRRSLFPCILVLLVVIGLGAYLLIVNALSQDADVLQRSRVFIARSLEQQRNEAGRNIIDYSKWGEAYLHLHRTVDTHWAYERNNVGVGPFKLYGYNGVWVVDAAGRTVYGVLDGQRSAVQLADWLQGDVAGLLDAARAPEVQDGSVVRILQVGGVPAIVAAASITTGRDETVSMVPGPASVMMFVTLLDSAWFAQLSEQYGLPALQPSGQALPGYESMPLLDSPTLLLNWDPPEPGRALLRTTLPVFAGGVALLLAVLFLLLRNALVSARQIESQLLALHGSRSDLQNSEQRFRDMAETSSDWLWEADAEGRITYLSDRFSEVTGLDRSAWLGRPLADLLRREDAQPLAPWLGGAVPGGGEGGAGRGTLLCHIDDHAGLRRVCRITARVIQGGLGFRGTATDLTDEWQAQERLRHLSLHDALTGLANRRQLHEFLAARLDPTAGGEPAVTVLCLDLDRFKPINDALGHALGDQVLQEVARRLQALVGPRELAARLGGDEFILVLAGTLPPEEVDRRCAAVVAALARPFQLGDHTVQTGTSIGVALAPLHARTADELLRQGDIALYDAKAAGRNTWRCYTQALDLQGSARLQMERELRLAQRRGQLRLHYQPCHAVEGGALRGLQALVRWQHPEKGLLLPGAFMPLARETGLVRALGAWVIDTACRDAAGWPADLRVSVKLAGGQFGDAAPGVATDDLPSVVARALEGSGLPAARLELEIDECILLAHGAEALQTLTELKRLGVRLTLGDFGAGFASLACMRDPLLDGLKIGPGFVTRLPERLQGQAILQALGLLARSLGLPVRAEGVESQAQWDCLQRQPVDEVQGFPFRPALPADQLAPLWAGMAAPGTPGSG